MPNTLREAIELMVNKETLEQILEYKQVLDDIHKLDNILERR